MTTARGLPILLPVLYARPRPGVEGIGRCVSAVGVALNTELFLVKRVTSPTNTGRLATVSVSVVPRTTVSPQNTACLELR